MPFDIPISSGGNVGGLHIPQQREHETSAFAEVNKAALGIVYDSIAKVLTDLSPRYNFGYLGGFGYRATPDRNVLDHPLETTRMTNAFESKGNDSWMPLYDAMMHSIPPGILRHLLYENDKPFNQRNSSFVALDNLIKIAARALAQVYSTSQPAPAESLETSRTTMNILLPFALLQNSLQNSKETAKAAYSFLQSEGANFPNFDSYTKLLGDMKGVIQLMDLVDNGLNDTPGGRLNDATRNAATKATLMLATINDQIGRVNPGNDLQILSSTFQSMETVLTALSLPTVAIGALYISLNTALMGTTTNNSALGFIGPNLSAVINNISDGTAVGILPNKEYAGAKLLSNLIAFSLIGAIGITAQMLDPGFGTLPSNDATSEASARYFAFEIALGMLSSSGAIKELYKEFIATAGGDAKAQEKGSLALEQITLLLMMYTGSLIANRPIEDLVNDHSSQIEQSIEAIKDLQEHKDIAASAEVSIALEQANAALQNKDFIAFKDAINGLIESLSSSQGIQDDLKVAAGTIKDLFTSMGASKDDEPRTEMINVV